jgi:integrating conjugative element protein (TIGR03749 family)
VLKKFSKLNRLNTTGFISAISFLLLCLFSHSALADDPLMLSQAEMQKLKQYFPNDSSGDGEHFHWQGNPIAITLPLNQEKRIVFPQGVTPDLKSALTTDQLRLINDHDSLYLTALKPFLSTRMFVTLNDSNDVVMLDISTDSKADNGIAYIDLTQKKSADAGSIQQKTQEIQTSQINNNDADASSNNDNPGLSGNDADVTLIRFAWQQLFAPERLLSNSLNITRTPMHTEPFLSDLVYGDKVIAHPLLSWQLNQTYVTAIELRNKYLHYASINPAKDLCGNWQAATLYPRSTLKPIGSKSGDNTVLFLVSAKPFNESVEVCHGLA